MKTILTPLAALTYRPSESTLEIKLVAEAEMNLENAKVHFDRIGKLVGSNKYLALVDWIQSDLVNFTAHNYHPKT